MLLKVRKGPRELLQSIIGTNKPNLSDFSDNDSDDEESKGKLPTASRNSAAVNRTNHSAMNVNRTPAKSATRKRPIALKATNKKTVRIKIGVAERQIV